MMVKKQAIESMELKFVQDIIETLVQTLEANYSVCNVIESNFCYDYVRMEGLLESICSIVSDENTKAYVQLMLKDNKVYFRKAEKLIKILK